MNSRYNDITENNIYKNSSYKRLVSLIHIYSIDKELIFDKIVNLEQLSSKADYYDVEGRYEYYKHHFLYDLKNRPNPERDLQRYVKAFLQVCEESVDEESESTHSICHYILSRTRTAISRDTIFTYECFKELLPSIVNSILEYENPDFDLPSHDIVRKAFFSWHTLYTKEVISKEEYEHLFIASVDIIPEPPKVSNILPIQYEIDFLRNYQLEKNGSLLFLLNNNWDTLIKVFSNDDFVKLFNILKAKTDLELMEIKRWLVINSPLSNLELMDNTINFGYFFRYNTSLPHKESINKKIFIRVLRDELAMKINATSHSNMHVLKIMGDNLGLLKDIRSPLLDTIFIYFCTEVSLDFFVSTCEFIS